MSHRFSFLQYRMQVAAVLVMLAAVIVANGIATKRHLDKMNASVTTMYEDRLLASSYIFSLAGHMYELEAAAQHGQPNAAYPQAAINTLVRQYDNTSLTTQEAAIWALFKNDLKVYETAFNRHVNASEALASATANLKQLEAIQASEGKLLFQSLSSGIKGSFIRYSLEMAIAVVVGIVALALIGISKNRFLPVPKNERLN